MKSFIVDNYKRWRKDFKYKTLFNSTLSFLINIAFVLYNAYLYFFYKALYNGSIAIYYFFLIIIRGIVLNKERKKENDNTWCHRITSLLLIVMTLALSLPITLLVFNERSVKATFVSSILFALYTTIKTVMASINLKRVRRSDDILIRELRNINFIDALVSILTLQNTLIIVNSSEENLPGMRTLTSYTSFFIYLLILLIALFNYRMSRGKKDTFKAVDSE